MCFVSVRAATGGLGAPSPGNPFAARPLCFGGELQNITKRPQFVANLPIVLDKLGAVPIWSRQVRKRTRDKPHNANPAQREQREQGVSCDVSPHGGYKSARARRRSAALHRGQRVRRITNGAEFRLSAEVTSVCAWKYPRGINRLINLVYCAPIPGCRIAPECCVCLSFRLPHRPSCSWSKPFKLNDCGEIFSRSPIPAPAMSELLKHGCWPNAFRMRRGATATTAHPKVPRSSLFPWPTPRTRRPVVEALKFPRRLRRRADQA